MARHAAPDEEPDVGPAVQAVPTADGPIVVPVESPKKPLSAKLFEDKNLPHWGMFAIAIMYTGFNIAVGVAGVPQTISLAFSGTLGLWFNYLIRQRANKESD